MRVRIFAAAVVLSGCAGGTQASPGPVDEYALFPAGRGRDVTIRVCSDCHSPDVAARQQLDFEGWRIVVDQMASQGAVATQAELDQILLYLSASFPASRH